MGNSAHTHILTILLTLTGNNAYNLHLFLLARTQSHGHLIAKEARKCSLCSGQPGIQLKLGNSFGKFLSNRN